MAQDGEETDAAREDLWLTYQNYDPAVKQAVRRLGAPFAPKPSTPGLEKLSYPQVEDIERVAGEMLNTRR